MGGSSSKRTFFWRKKKSPIKKAWSQVRGALPNKNRRKKSILSLDKLKLHNRKREKHSKKRLSLSDKKEPIALKRLSLGNIKVSIETAPPGREKDGGGLGKAGEQKKKKISQEPTVRKGSALEKISKRKSV